MPKKEPPVKPAESVGVPVLSVAPAPDPPWRSLRSDPFFALVLRNPVLSVTAAGFLLVVIEVMGAADYRVNTALAIVAAADTAKVVLGVAAAVGPWLLAPIILMFWSWYQEHAAAGHGPQLQWVVVFTLGFFTFVLTPVSFLVIYFGITLILFVLFPRIAARTGRGVSRVVPPGSQRTAYYSTLVLSGLFTIVQVRASWLPEEQVELRSGQQLVGFVIDDSRAVTTLLVQPDRAIVKVAVEDVVSRSICHRETSWFFQSVSENLRRSVYPACPALTP
jgi:hypothetical protein